MSWYKKPRHSSCQDHTHSWCHTFLGCCHLSCLPFSSFQCWLQCLCHQIAFELAACLSKMMFPSNWSGVHSTPSPPVLLCSCLCFSPSFWGFLGLTVSHNHGALCLFRVKACRKCHPRMSASLWSSNIRGFVEMGKIQLSFLYRKTAVFSV